MPLTGPCRTGLVEEESQRIAAIAASICAIVDPEAVILTGGVGANSTLVARASALINELAPFPPAVIRSALGERASLVGALAVAVRSAQSTLISNAGDGNHAPISATESAPSRESPALPIDPLY